MSHFPARGWLTLLILAAWACSDKEASTKAPGPAIDAATDADAGDPLANSPKPDPAREILATAIQAHGGAERLQAAASLILKVAGRDQGGTAYTATWSLKGQHQRGDFQWPSGKKMSIVRGPQHCWIRTGRVVLPCKTIRPAQEVMARWFSAILFLPGLDSESPLIAGQVEIGDRHCDSLIMAWPDHQAMLTLIFDPRSHLLVRSELTTTIAGMTALQSLELSGHREYCGIQLATRFSHTLDEKPVDSFEVTEAQCGPVDDQAFVQPAQVTDGTVEEKLAPGSTVACTTLKGSHTGIDAAFEKLFGFLQRKQLHPLGAPLITYLKAPPEVLHPRKYVTEICHPVAGPAPRRARKHGAFVVKFLKPQSVLSIYAMGHYRNKADQMREGLVEEAGKRKLKISGPMRQVIHLHPRYYPPRQVLSEMMVPVLPEEPVR